MFVGAIFFKWGCLFGADTRYGPGKDTNLLRSFLVLKSPPDSSQSESVEFEKTFWGFGLLWGW